jgi:hypothetical protein
MSDTIRKKSPRAPSIALGEAIDRVSRVYEKEKRHPTPTEVVAQDMGYKGVNNGTALAALASLRYYGLLERPEEGKLAVSKDFENFQYAPDESVKRAILMKWLRTPPIFAELIDRYPGGFPSDANLRFELMNRKFSPSAAESVITVFRRSAEFVGFDGSEGKSDATVAPEVQSDPTISKTFRDSGPVLRTSSPLPSVEIDGDQDDKIPVRLSGGRKAWLIIPSPFYEADKARLKAQIDLLLSEES